MTVLLKPKQGGRPIVLDKPILLVGRHPECDLILETSPKISRKHCFLALAEDRCYVRDLESMNGVWVNGRRVTDTVLLEIGDDLMIGDVEFEISRHQQKVAPKPAPRRDLPEPDFPTPAKKRVKVDDERTLADADGAAGIEFDSDFSLPLDSPSRSSDDHVIPLAELDD